MIHHLSTDPLNYQSPFHRHLYPFRLHQSFVPSSSPIINFLIHWINSVNEKEQIMKSNVWLRMLWKDPQLAWNKADYGGITSIRLPPELVWTPDIVLYNNADGKYEVSYC